MTIITFTIVIVFIMIMIININCASPINYLFCNVLFFSLKNCFI